MHIHSAGWYATAVLVMSTLGAFAQVGTGPAAPTGLAVQSVTDSTITLVWTGSADAVVYWVQSSVDGVSAWTIEGQVRAVGDPTAPQTFTLRGYQPGSVRYFSIVAANADGQKACRPVKAVTNLLGLPTLTATLVGTTATLTWSVLDGAETYTVQRRTPAGSGAYTTIVTLGPKDKSYKDAGLTAGTSYEYEVVATNADSNTATSLPASVTVTVTPLTLTPATATLAPGGTQMFTLAPAVGLTCAATGGSVSVTLQYTAPATPGTYTVSATAGGQTASAVVTVK